MSFPLTEQDAALILDGLQEHELIKNAVDYLKESHGATELMDRFNISVDTDYYEIFTIVAKEEGRYEMQFKLKETNLAFDQETFKQQNILIPKKTLRDLAKQWIILHSQETLVSVPLEKPTPVGAGAALLNGIIAAATAIGNFFTGIFSRLKDLVTSKTSVQYTSLSTEEPTSFANKIEEAGNHDQSVLSALDEDAPTTPKSRKGFWTEIRPAKPAEPTETETREDKFTPKGPR